MPANNSPQISDMSITQLTGAMLSLKEAASIQPPKQLADTQKRIGELEKARESKQPDGKFPLGVGSALHDMLHNNSSEEIATIISREPKRSSFVSTQSNMNGGNILKHTPEKSWDKIMDVGKVIASQQGISQNQQTILYFADEFVRAMDELSGPDVTHKELKNVLSQTPTLLVDAECKEMIRTEQSRQRDTEQKIDTAREIPLNKEHSTQSMGR